MAIRAELPEDGVFSGEHPGRLLEQRRLPRLPAAHLLHLRLPGHPRLRLRHGAGRPGRRTRRAGRLDQRRRRLRVQRAGAGDHGAADIPLIAIVFNDNAYGNVKRIQQLQFGGREIASDLVQPRLDEAADAFGVEGRRANSPENLRAVLEAALAATEPTLIAVPIGPVPSPWTALGLR